jgi:hypothetical protein
VRVYQALKSDQVCKSDQAWKGGPVSSDLLHELPAKRTVFLSYPIIQQNKSMQSEAKIQFPLYL